AGRAPWPGTPVRQPSASAGQRRCASSPRPLRFRRKSGLERRRPELPHQVSGDLFSGDVPVERKAWPGIQIDQHDRARGRHNRIATEYFEAESGSRPEDSRSERGRLEGVARERLVAMIKPLEPGEIQPVGGTFGLSDAVKLDEISGDMLLDDRAVDAPRRKILERGGERVRLHDKGYVAGLGGVNVASLDPARKSESLHSRLPGRRDENARREGHTVPREERDRSLAVGIANALGPVDDADALTLPGGQTRDERHPLAHDK